VPFLEANMHTFYEITRLRDKFQDLVEEWLA
jgi:hypothetical protein